MINRRNFIIGSIAFIISNILISKKAEAFLPLLFRVLVRSSAGRHMGRFGRAGSRLKHSGKFKKKSSKPINTYGLTIKQFSRISRNARLIKKFSEIVYDNQGIGFPSKLNKDVSALCGGNDNDVFCTSFSTSGAPVVFELPELLMLETVGDQLPQLYKKEFGGKNEARSNKNILSCIHPISKIKDGEFDNEWNHITPLIYNTACGKVTMQIMETDGKCIIERHDIKEVYIVPIKFSSVDIITGMRT